MADFSKKRAEFKGKVSTTNPPKKVIFVVGESHQRGKFGLYGYFLDNTPNLVKLENSGNLFKFNSVYSADYQTVKVLEHLIDFSNADGVSAGLDVVSLFSYAGFKTNYISTQTQMGREDENKQFLVASVADNVRWIAQKDEAVLEFVQNTNLPEFYFIHLTGAHLTYKNRYTSAFAKFSGKDVAAKMPNLTKDQSEIVAEYANANLYTDFVLAQIWQKVKHEDAVMVFLSDHGENLFDYDGTFGRSGRRHNVLFEIPFLVILSDEFKAKRPEMVEKLRLASERSFVSDDTIHMLANLCGINHAEYDPKRDILEGEVKRSLEYIFATPNE